MSERATGNRERWGAVVRSFWVLVLALCGQAVAADKFAVMRHSPDGNGYVLVQEHESDWISIQAGAIMHYDNWTTAVDSPPGRTVIRGGIRMNGDEYGDHMVLSNYHQGIADSFGHSMSNDAPAGNLTRYEVVWRWYDASDLSLLGSFSLRVGVLFPFRPGDQVRVRQDEGFVLDQNIPLAPEIYFSTQYSSAEGISYRDIGILYGSPNNTGASPRMARNFTTGAEFNPGGDPSYNLVNYMKGEPIPAPAASALLLCNIATLSVAGFRRRVAAFGADAANQPFNPALAWWADYGEANDL